MTPYAELSTPPISLVQPVLHGTLSLPSPRPGVTETRDGLLRVVTAPHPLLLRLEGEADLSNRDLLAATLRTMTAPGTSDLHVDLRRLDFIDVGCLALLHRAYQVLIRQGRRLRVYGAPPVARKAMRLLGWEMPAEEGATP